MLPITFKKSFRHFIHEYFYIKHEKSQIVLSAIFISPVTQLVKNLYQRMTALCQGIFYFWRDLRVYITDNEIICFEFFQILAQRFIRNLFQIALHLIESTAGAFL